jgi:hypothetical protein
MKITPLDDSAIDEMFGQIMTTVTKLERRRTLGRRMTALAGAVAIAAGITGGVLVVIQASATMKNVAECYASTDLNSHHTGVVVADKDGQAAQTPSSVNDRIATGTENCGAVWRLGRFEADPNAVQSGRDFPVPNLVACTLPDGRFAYFPSANSASEVCSHLGLAVAGD